MYRYGLIGNCQASALVSETASIDWLCLPRPDSDPVFGRLLDPAGGHFSIELASPSAEWRCEQRYVENTNVLVTEVTGRDGSGFRVTDFCPRFEQHGRMYRPLSVFRVVDPIGGGASIQVRCKPVDGWTKQPVAPVRGNSHVRYDLRGDSLRLVTNMPLTYLLEETPFQIKERIYFGLTWSTGIEEDLAEVSQKFLERTKQYWLTWVKHCSIPSQYQKEVIRSALALKLHVYEDTGAILAALTTSLPEQPGNERNWDYRYCWLRDSYFVLSAFHALGHFEEMEGFIRFLLDIALKHEHSRDRLAPVYTLSQGLPLPETRHENWEGYAAARPVRSNNQAAEHVQNDVYGEMVLTLAPIFFDERFRHLRTSENEELLSHLAGLCARTISQPDAGLWEIRNGWQEHTFSNLMCWAGLERIERIQALGYLKGLKLDVRSARERAEKAIQSAVIDGSLRNGPKDPSFEASAALLPALRYPDRDLSTATLDQILKTLKLEEGFYYRYTRMDDFGNPDSAFMICSFWVAQSLAQLDRKEEARHIMDRAMRAANEVGLYSEHFLPGESAQRGNFPQAYSHVGLINAAFAVSPPWSDVL